MSKTIYLDYHATTPCDPRVVEAMLPFFTEHFGNPSSTTHGVGDYAAAAIETARAQVSTLIGASANEIVLTSGSTESNNLAIWGVARQHRKVGGTRRRLVTSAIEHKSVLGPYSHLAEDGWDVVVLPVDHEGTVNLNVAEEVINGDTLLVSIQAANHEIGTIQPVSEVAKLAHRYGALVHCDAAQAVGKIVLDVQTWDVDLLSLSGHKLYGPKGAGALWLRGGPKRLPIEPISTGGGQESSLRPGTINVPAVVGLGTACLLCEQEIKEDPHFVRDLRDTLERILLEGIPGLQRNGNLISRLPGNSSLTLPYMEAEMLLANLPRLALSTGSACESGAMEPSRILIAIGLPHQAAFSTVRLGLGRFTTLTEVEDAASQITYAYSTVLDEM